MKKRNTGIILREVMPESLSDKYWSGIGNPDYCSFWM
jgi:hypothetical protein